MAPRMLVVLALVTACAKPATTTRSPNDAAPKHTPVERPAKAVPLTAEQSYARAMPATVLVTTAWGHGTGVVIDPRGLVLTNYHVVAQGKDEDFGITATVVFPEHHDDGSVSPGVKYTAHAIKIDDKRDLALLAVDAPGKKFPALEVSAGDPQPGTRVLAIGNAGVGLGWALKRCAVNAVGTLDEQVGAMLSAQREDISDVDREKAKAALAQAAADAGKQVQTDCNILPGDSGGPLIDEQSGQIVGLNVALRTAFSQFVPLGSLAFHVHATELRTFLHEIPDGPAALVPDPWIAAGNMGQLSDIDADGEIDTLNFSGACGDNLTCQVVLADLDENSFRGKKELPAAADLQKSRAFEAELALLKLARLPRKPSEFPMPVSDTLAWIDRDDDGKFDVLVVIDGETNATRGYKLGGARPERDTSLDTVSFASLGDLYAKPKLRPAVARLTGSLTSGTTELGAADKIYALTARLEDHSGNGTPDTLHVETRLDKRALFDLGETALAKLGDKPARSKPALRGIRTGSSLVTRLRSGRVHGDVMVVEANTTRVLYDRDHDGAFDLVLEGSSLDNGVALAAANIDASGKLTAVPEHLGRRLLRPALITDKTRREMLVKLLATTFPSAPTGGTKDDAASFPPALPTRALGVTRVGGELGDHVLSVSEPDGVVVLVDLDKNAFKGKHAGKDPLKLIQDGKYDAELTLRFLPGIAYAYYDADDDGRFEQVRLASPVDPKRVAIAFKLGKGTATLDPTREGNAMMDPTQFKGAAMQKLCGEIAAKLFP